MKKKDTMSLTLQKIPGLMLIIVSMYAGYVVPMDKKVVVNKVISGLKDSLKQGQEFQEKNPQGTTRQELFNAYVNRWKQVIKEFDWEKLRLYVQENIGLSIAGKIAVIESLPRIKGNMPVLSSDEKEVLVTRAPSMNDAFNTFLSTQKNVKPLRIGIACAGGGYQGMISAAGFLSALQEQGVVDCASYCASSSGATWMVGSWYLLQLHYGNAFGARQWTDMIRGKIQNNHFNMFGAQRLTDKAFLASQIKLFAQKVLLPKVAFGQIISAVDFLGFLLSVLLLDDLGDEKFTRYFSSLWPVVAHGTMPWPLFTAVAMNKDTNTYDMYEFNPEQVRNSTLKKGFAVYGFDKKFKAGTTYYGAQSAQQPINETRDIAIEPSFGSMLGLFGSCYAMNWDELKGVVLQGKNTDAFVADIYKKPLESIVRNVKNVGDIVKNIKGTFSSPSVQSIIEQASSALFVKAIEGAVLDKTVSLGGASLSFNRSMRLSPAQVRNPFYAYDDQDVSAWLKEQEYCTFLDSAFWYDVPLRPFFSPERAVDIVIVCDPYTDTTHMDSALADIKNTYGISYTGEQGTDSSFMLYRPDTNALQYPLILRLRPLSGGVSRLRSIASPLDMRYSLEEFDALIAACHDSVNAHIKDIQGIMLSRVQQHMATKLSGFGS